MHCYYAEGWYRYLEALVAFAQKHGEEKLKSFDRVVIVLDGFKYMGDKATKATANKRALQVNYFIDQYKSKLKLGPEWKKRKLNFIRDNMMWVKTNELKQWRVAYREAGKVFFAKTQQSTGAKETPVDKAAVQGEKP